MTRTINRIVWRWEEKDFGFRFRAGKGKRTEEYYQAARAGEFYIVPRSKRKLKKDRADELASTATAPTSPKVVKLPWTDYDQHWDWITADDGVLMNYAGCLDREELNRREDEGVARAREYIALLLSRPNPVPLTIALVQQVHHELMGEIYPFSGTWRRVDLHKGDGPTKWPLPRVGIQTMMDLLQRDVFGRSPFLSEDDDEVFAFASEVMNELLAIHPFREGNGRTAFIVGDLILMQNGLLPLGVYDRKNDEESYFAACEAGRLQQDYAPLAELIAKWEGEAVARWEANHAT
ncbi:MAG: Fic family protein [Pseudomonadota bacterium]|nr:Fic family protein [Pseudomonadota bacterium]